MKSRSVMGWFLLLGSGLGPVSAQEVYESDLVMVVELPVQVLKDGQPVAGLGPEHFLVTEDGSPLDLVSFQVVDLTEISGEAAVPSAIPSSGARNLLLFFDLSFTRRYNLTKALEVSEELLESGLHPTDRVAVAVFSPVLGVELLSGFTTHHARISKLVQALKTAARPGEANDGGENDAPAETLAALNAKFRHIGIGLETREGPAGEALRSLIGAGGKGGDGVSETLVAFEQAYKMSHSRQRGSRVRNLMRSLAGLGDALKNVKGQKYLILFSQGFDETFMNVNDTLETSKEIVLADLDRFLKVLRQSGWAIHAVDLGGVGAPGSRDGRATLYMLAKDTGGRLYGNNNDTADAVSRMLTSTSLSYLLAIQPSGIKRDGAYHRLKLKLKDAPAGAKIVNPAPGYYAPGPEDVLLSEQRLELTEMILGDEEGGAFSSALLAAPFKGEESLAKVSFILEVDGTELLAQHSGQVLDLDVQVYALAEDGGISDAVFNRSRFDLTNTASQQLHGGIRMGGEVNLSAGNYTLRALLFDRQTQTHSLTSLALRVPDNASGEPFLLTPLFPEVSESMLTLGQGTGNGSASMFKVGNRAFSPKAKPVLQAGATVPLILMGFNFEDGATGVSYRITDREGLQQKGGAFQLVPSSLRVEDGVFHMLASFDPIGLMAGDYQLEIHIQGMNEEPPLSSRIGFTVRE